MKAKYVNPFTDFGFKKIFGEEASKPLLTDFLNSLLPADSKIRDLSFKNTEHLGQTEIDRKSLFDIYCEAESGEKFIVELQKAKQNYFKERTVYYSTFPIREQAERGDWNYSLKAVYCIGILDFTFDDYQTEQERKEVVHTIQLKNQHGQVFYEKLTYIYLEMPNFRLQENELKTRLDQWLYFIKHLEDFQTIPTIFKNEVVFEQAFEKAALAKLDHAQWESYERSMREFRDAKNIFDYAVEQATEKGFNEGMEKGMEKGIEKGLEKGKQIKDEAIKEVARQVKAMGLPAADISKMTGLNEEEINAL
jgi:predicted transposase/invertase (TIGR01784 family)